MKQRNGLVIISLMISLVWMTACKDDSDSSGPASSTACETPCSKAVACSMYSSSSQCITDCTESYSSSEISCVSNCDSSQECSAWFVCADACFPEVQGNGEYCPGYVMGSDDDECCQTNNPCDWADDFFCDCGGTCSWDDGDCSEK